MTMRIGEKSIGVGFPTYFIADIAANHDGSLERAKSLIHLAHLAGADAAKFQHFKASSIVSEHGFAALGPNTSHQTAWVDSVIDVYDAASIPDDWTIELYEECKKVGITFLSTPYNERAVDELDPLVPAYKIGSGDIDWLKHIEHIAQKGKPVLLAIGAAEMGEVRAAVEAVTKWNTDVAILQCNTNYTGNETNVDHINLQVLTTLHELWPDAVLGLSDHTSTPEPVVGAVALGARIIERHFTDDTTRSGPDHGFALDPTMWADMVGRVRTLERALGSSHKTIEANEQDSVVVQRRCLRFRRDLPSGHTLRREDIDVLRPATPGGLSPADLDSVLGATLTQSVLGGREITRADIDSH